MIQSISEDQVTRNLNFSEYILVLLFPRPLHSLVNRKWRRPSGAKIWARSKIRRSLWLLPRQSQHRPWWTPHCNRSHVSLQCHKGWRNCFPWCSGLYSHLHHYNGSFVLVLCSLWWNFCLQESSRLKVSVNKDGLSDCAKKGIAGELLLSLRVF